MTMLTCPGVDSAPRSPVTRHRAVLATLHQFPWDARQQMRNPAAMFFTLALPVLFLVAFSVTSGDATSAATYYVPATMGLAVASGTLTNLAVTLTYLREFGQLKRVLVTPLPRGAFLGSRILAAAMASVLTCLVLGALGRVLYDASPQQLPLLVLAVLLILVCGSALGVAITTVIHSETASAPIANAIGLPLMLASGVFFPLETTPSWFASAAAYLPFTRCIDLAVASYQGTGTVPMALRAILTSCVWALAASVIALRFFAWAPRKRR